MASYFHGVDHTWQGSVVTEIDTTLFILKGFKSMNFLTITHPHIQICLDTYGFMVALETFFRLLELCLSRSWGLAVDELSYQRTLHELLHCSSWDYKEPCSLCASISRFSAEKVDCLAVFAHFNLLEQEQFGLRFTNFWYRRKRRLCNYDYKSYHLDTWYHAKVFWPVHIVNVLLLLEMSPQNNTTGLIFLVSYCGFKTRVKYTKVSLSWFKSSFVTRKYICDKSQLG